MSIPTNENQVQGLEGSLIEELFRHYKAFRPFRAGQRCQFRQIGDFDRLVKLGYSLNQKVVLVNVDQYQILHLPSSVLPDLRKSSQSYNKIKFSNFLVSVFGLSKFTEKSERDVDQL